MPSLSDPSASSLVKMLNVGESGSGKTGALASLAVAGYNIHILDADGSLAQASTLKDVLRDNPEATSRIKYKVLKDQITMIGGKPQIKPPLTAYKGAGRTLESWGVGAFTSQDILVLDTLTSLSESAFVEACALAGRWGRAADSSDRPRLQEYGWMADSIKLFIELLTSEAIPCHVIVNTHVRYLAAEDEALIAARDKSATFTRALGLPNARGQEISRIVARYFNTVVFSCTQGVGIGARRKIFTQPQGVIEVKTSAPSRVKREYGVETGLAEFFKDVLGHGPTPGTSGQAVTAPSKSAQIMKEAIT